MLITSPTTPLAVGDYRVVWQAKPFAEYLSPAFEAWFSLELVAIRFADANEKAAKARARLAKVNAPKRTKVKQQKKLKKAA